MHEPCRDEHLVARTAFACKAELVVDLADVRVPCPAKSTAATGDYALGNTTIARPDILDARADSLGRSRPLMSDRQGIADIVWIDLAAQELEIRAADTTEGRTDHDLSRTRFESGKIDHANHPRPGYN